MTSLHSCAVDTLRTWTPPTPAQALLREDYLALLAADERAPWRDGLPDHLTASALVMSCDTRRVLLTLHAKAGQWFQLGGHCEADDATLAAAALREGTEESGIAGLRLDPDPVQLDVHPVPFCGDPRTRHFDVRFLAWAPEGAAAKVSDESLDVAWFDVDALPTREPGILALVELALLRAQSSASSSSGTACSDAADHPSR